MTRQGGGDARHSRGLLLRLPHPLSRTQPVRFARQGKNRVRRKYKTGTSDRSY